MSGRFGQSVTAACGSERLADEHSFVFGFFRHIVLVPLLHLAPFKQVQLHRVPSHDQAP